MHPYLWGIVMILSLVPGRITPPVGLALFTVSEVAQVSIKDVLKSLGPFLLLDLGVLALVATVPAPFSCRVSSVGYRRSYESKIGKGFGYSYRKRFCKSGIQRTG